MAKKTTEEKILAEAKKQTKLLKEIKEILDNTWRDRRPEGGN